MMLRQEAALDRSIDRKVRILLRLRKESTNLPVAPGQDDGGKIENIEGIPESDIAYESPQAVEAVQDIKMKERCGNVIENKGSRLESRQASGNIAENKDSYTQNAGMLLKTKGVIGNAESNATSKWPSILPVSDDGRFRRQVPGGSLAEGGSNLDPKPRRTQRVIIVPSCPAEHGSLAAD
jgi:hypothetical protein